MSDSGPLGVLDAIPREIIGPAIARLAARLMVEAPEPNGRPADADAEASEEYLTPKDVAEWLHVDVRWVQRHARELGGVRLSPRALRFPRSRVERFLKARAR